MSTQFSTNVKQHGNIPWDAAQMSIGNGFDILTYESMPSPFNKINGPKSERPDIFPEVEVQAQLFRKHEELTAYLESATTALVPSLSAASVRAIATTMKSARCDDLNMCLLLRCAISTNAEHFDQDLVLSSYAEELLGDPEHGSEDFVQSYGQYCIAGQIRQSHFFAICTYTSKTAEELDSFASSLGATGDTKMLSGESTASLLERIELHASSIQQSHKLYVAGIEGSAGLEWLESARVSDAWEAFQEDYCPVPYVAVIKHYSSILPGRVSRPTQPYDIPREAVEALWRCTILQVTARSQPGYRASTVTRLDVLKGRLSNLAESNSTEAKEETRQIKSKLEKIRVHLSEPTWPTIRANLDKLAKEDKPGCIADRWSHDWYNDSGEDSWDIGIVPTKAKEFGIAAQQVIMHEKTCVLPDTGTLITQKPDILRLFAPGQRFIGARIKNRYHNPRHGGKWARVGNWLGEDTFSLRFETQHTRGCDWQVLAWSVPKDLNEIEDVD